jgi:hypothetical protein
MHQRRAFPVNPAGISGAFLDIPGEGLLQVGPFQYFLADEKIADGGPEAGRQLAADARLNEGAGPEKDGVIPYAAGFQQIARSDVFVVGRLVKTALGINIVIVDDGLRIGKNRFKGVVPSFQGRHPLDIDKREFGKVVAAAPVRHVIQASPHDAAAFSAIRTFDLGNAQIVINKNISHVIAPKISFVPYYNTLSKENFSISDNFLSENNRFVEKFSYISGVSTRRETSCASL